MLDYYARNRVSVPMPNGTSIILRTSQREESYTRSEYDYTGLTIWPGAKVLCSYLMNNLDSFQSTSILELGCGTGFVVSE